MYVATCKHNSQHASPQNICPVVWLHATHMVDMHDVHDLCLAHRHQHYVDIRYWYMYQYRIST